MPLFEFYLTRAITALTIVAGYFWFNRQAISLYVRMQDAFEEARILDRKMRLYVMPLARRTLAAVGASASREASLARCHFRRRSRTFQSASPS